MGGYIQARRKTYKCDKELRMLNPPAGESEVGFNRSPQRSVPSERRKSGHLQPELVPLLLDAVKGSNL